MRRIGPAALCLAALVAGGCGDDVEDRTRQVTVMSRNLYLGAPIEPLLQLSSPGDIPAAAMDLWDTVVASDIPARAKAIAGEIAATQPDLVGLQEATLWRSQVPADGTVTRAEHVEYDFVKLIVDELAASGLRYDAVATSTNFDAELTGYRGDPSGAIDLRMTDRDVILARAGVSVRDAADARYDAKVQMNAAGILPIAIPRGWTSVVATAGGATLRFVNTHLEIGTFEAIQAAQAQELTAVLSASSLPTVLVGDLNSNAIPAGGDNTPSYGTVTGAGFTDTWSVLHPSDPGLTCCQDGSLRNATSALWERIDLVLYRGRFTPKAMDVVGETPGERTASGVWPSDHAGVVAALDAEASLLAAAGR